MEDSISDLLNKINSLEDKKKQIDLNKYNDFLKDYIKPKFSPHVKNFQNYPPYKFFFDRYFKTLTDNLKFGTLELTLILLQLYNKPISETEKKEIRSYLTNKLKDISSINQYPLEKNINLILKSIFMNLIFYPGEFVYFLTENRNPKILKEITINAINSLILVHYFFCDAFLQA